MFPESRHVILEIRTYYGVEVVCILAEQDKLLDQTSVSHLFPITKYLGLLATGMTGLHSFMEYKDLNFWLIVSISKGSLSISQPFLL